MTKADLRKIYKSKRQLLTEKHISELSEAIFTQFKTKFDLKGKPISIFLPIEHLKEINTWSFLNDYPATYFLPVVKSDYLIHVKFESLAQLKRTEWGILEPQFGHQAPANIFEAVIVPLLAFDKDGNRVGYGKGFYDGFLKKCDPHCLFIGLSYFEAEEDAIETSPTDIRLDYCITPKQIYHFKNTKEQL